MRLTRRGVIGLGGGAFAALSLPPVTASAAEVIDIAMAGRADGSRVWFDPLGIHVEAGQSVRWTNNDPGNSHTATAYHPANSDRPRRMPEAAEPWDSGYLLPGQSFSVIFSVAGVYDYYCVPHEMAGMVGRIVVGRPGPGSWLDQDGAGADLPDIALRALPPVEAILKRGMVRAAED